MAENENIISAPLSEPGNNQNNTPETPQNGSAAPIQNSAAPAADSNPVAEQQTKKAVVKPTVVQTSVKKGRKLSPKLVVI